MKRKAKVLLITSMATLALAGCSLPGKSSNGANGKIKVDDSAFRVANKSPDSYEDYGETRAADYYIKATGFEYDYDNLKYDLVWSDEFDYDGLPDETKWTYDVGKGTWGWGNNELQSYTNDSNAWVKDGHLTIELRKEESDGDDGKYTSARLKTKGLGDWLYGKFEVRAKLPKGKGTWPAIWMLPTDTKEYGSWPASGEIDIMEHVGYLQDVLHFNAHNKSFNGANGQNKGRSIPFKGVSEDYHVYSVEWLPDKIIFSVDGEETFTYDPHDYVDEVQMDQWPYDKPFHLLINIAYGGNWGGAAGIDDSCLPQQMEVDYVRVYQSEEISALAK